MTPSQSRAILLAAAAYNITGGLAVIFLLDLFAPAVGIASPATNMLFRLFVGGTAVTFGLMYQAAARAKSLRATVLLFGTGLKFWAFVASLVSYLFYDLSATVFVLFGITNLVFAGLFTVILTGGSTKN